MTDQTENVKRYTVVKELTDHRVIEICWLPQTEAEWKIFTSARLDAGSLWTRLCIYHEKFRKPGEKWPTYYDLEKVARGQFPSLSAQSVQQIVKDFCDAIEATTASRKVPVAGQPLAKYPWKTKKYFNVIYSNQAALIKNGILQLSHGRKSKPLYIKIPSSITLPGCLMEVQLAFGIIRLICKIEKEELPAGTPIGVDLGVNTLVGATDGHKAILVSGREAKSVVRFRNKSIGSLDSMISKCKKGSKRHKKLCRAKYKMLDKSRNKLKDILHKATRIIANEFPNAPVIVGKPFNAAAQKLGRKQAQQVSSASNAKIIHQLGYKMAGTDEVNEAYSSQTCPVCGCRQKCRRIYQCRECGFKSPRDVVGMVNIRRIRIPETPIPTDIRFVRPLRTYRGSPKGEPRRSGGIPAQALNPV